MPRELIDLEQARGLVLTHAVRLGSEDTPLENALGRVLSRAVTSTEPVPGFDNSAMDGFAVRAQDTLGASPAAPVVLRAVDESRAGHPARRSVEAGEAIAISTGAVIPAGADAVVRIEDVFDRGAAVDVRVAVKADANIRRAGEDVRAGAVALDAGAVVGPFELGVLASVGAASVPCVRRPTLRMLSTGDELIEMSAPMRPGGVRNSNAVIVPALARLAGAQVTGVGSVGDDAAETRAAVAQTLACDIAVMCGGVSVGAHDHVRPALTACGAQEVFWGVALRPGKPTWFGTTTPTPGGRATLAFGLPGNPVSALVTFLLFVRPAIRLLSGADPAVDRITAILDEAYPREPGRTHMIRCGLRLRDDGWHARPTGPQGSHILTSMLGAEGLGIVPATSDGYSAGDRIEVEMLPRFA